MCDRHCDEPLCSLCGQPIAAKPGVASDALSREHVPPRQFYPKEIRKSQQTNLWVVPTHKRCNEGYRTDEEYFYHSLYVLVQKQNPRMGQVIQRDLMRRRHKPQTPAMARSLLKSVRTITEGGILLPPPVARFDLDRNRVDRVAIKIAQCLFYLREGRYMPRLNCKDIRLCQSESEVPELYEFSWQGPDMEAVLPTVFSYRCFEFENLHLFSMLFWEAVMFCAAFENPCRISEGPPSFQPGRPT